MNTGALQERFEELERERAKREAQVSVAAAEQQRAARSVDAKTSLADLLSNERERPSRPAPEAPDARSVKELKQAARDLGVDVSKCTEKADLLEAVTAAEDAESASDESDSDDDGLAAHRACEEGDVEELRQMTADDFCHKDEAGRTALFYACAHAREDCVAVILRKRPQSAGAAGCASLLLKSPAGKRGLVRSQNKAGMHPAHLAANVLCLEALLEHGADLAAKDGQGRTPLFVACAMNRYECASFILEVLDLEHDGDENKAVRPDHRGDSPLHAAACNGAEACVRLLLETGTSCDAQNQRGLRPVDLARRGGHAAAAKLLSEYRLHMSANFDSVLFLATVEGHRACKKLLAEALEREEGEAYEILKRTRDSRDLTRRDSRFSLKSSSLKLAQWGQWIAYEDADLAAVFWRPAGARFLVEGGPDAPLPRYNQATSEGSWDRPEAVAEAMRLAGTQDAAAWETLRRNSMRLDAIDDCWLRYRESGGDRTFYYNPTTGDFQWDDPTLPEPMETIPGGDTSRQLEEEEAAQADPAAGWAAYTDDATGATYWHNEASGESQWEKPDGIGDEAAHAVDTLDDLGV